jgi:hypothetical protein
MRSKLGVMHRMKDRRCGLPGRIGRPPVELMVRRLLTQCSGV